MAAICLLAIAGCGRQEPHETGRAQATDAGVTRTARRGPVTVTLTASSNDLALSDHLQLGLEVLADQGVTVFDPDYERLLSQGDHRFEYRVVRSEKEPEKATGDGKAQWTYHFELEFVLPGEYEVPAAEVSFADVRPGNHHEPAGRAPPGSNEESDHGGRSTRRASHNGEDVTATAEVQTVATEPITISVRTPAKAMSSEELRHITRLDPIDLPEPVSWRWAAAVILALVAGVAAVLLLLRRRSGERVAPVPAHEWAKQQMAALLAEDLIARGLVQAFHYRISAIVRGYIERRFGVSAPEMTTEEFLTTAAGDPRFGRGMTEDLNRFLGACDLVKYARHAPRSGEVNDVVKAAGDFVERTRERERAGGVSATSRPPASERAA